MKNQTTIQRTSEREIVVTRMFDGPARIVFEAWSTPELFKLWWIPKSYGITMHSCEMDVRTGGSYRLMLAQGEGEPMAFFGKYVEVTPPTRIVWTNEEGAGVVTTTVTFEEVGGQTRVVVHELHPSKESMEDSANGSSLGLVDSFNQLDELLATRI